MPLIIKKLWPSIYLDTKVLTPPKEHIKVDIPFWLALKGFKKIAQNNSNLILALGLVIENYTMSDLYIVMC